MKIRLGFVTNSSSTTHIMMWKGDKDKLRDLLEAHRKRFDLSYVDCMDEKRQVTSDQVAEAILSKLDTTETAKDYAAGKRAQAERNQEYIQEDPEHNQWLQGYSKGFEDLARRADMFDWVLQVGFGDNDGDFEGTDLGYVMDYEGRRIRIVDAERGFYYSTEQNR